MYEMLVGVAVGYIAFTDNGHKIGNSLADFMVKNGKPVVQKMLKNGGTPNGKDAGNDQV